MNFDYYYGSQADQFSFIKIPRVMITDDTFSNLSLQSKILYSLLLDRMALSRKNAWFDENNRVFIIYPITEIQSDLGFSKKKAMDYLMELEIFGLVEKKKRGFGLPSIIYVKSFMIQENTRSVDLGTTGTVIDQRKYRGSKTDTTRGSQIATTKVPDSLPQEVSGEIPLKNKYKTNKTNMSENESDHILSLKDTMGCDCDQSKTIHAYEQLIRENIEFETLLSNHRFDEELVHGIFELILETLLCQREYILIASEKYPASLVKNKFMKLNYSHVEYVISCVNGNTTKVKNIKKYLLAALFNASSTIDGYYRAKVNHDMPQYASN